MGALIVAGGDRLEALLASGIPDLQLADLLVDIDRTDLEIDTDCRHEVLLELIILSTMTHTNDKYLNKVVSSRLLTANLRRRQDLPTPELPIMSTLKR